MRVEQRTQFFLKFHTQTNMCVLSPAADHWFIGLFQAVELFCWFVVTVFVLPFIRIAMVTLLGSSSGSL